MASSVRIQATALRELDNALSYLASYSPQAAASFLAAWDEALVNLRDGLVEYRLCRQGTLARLGYHTILLGDYIALYYNDGDAAVIAHVFHQSQDYANIVLNGE